MNEKWKALFVGFGLIAVVLGGLWWIGRSVHLVREDTIKGSLNLEGRRLLYQMQQRLKSNYEQTQSFEGGVGENPMKTARFGAGFLGSQKTEATWWGVASYQQYLEQLCPDCQISKDSYKIITIGNVDEDPELDVWIQSSDQQDPIHFRND